MSERHEWFPTRGQGNPAKAKSRWNEKDPVGRSDWVKSRLKGYGQVRAFGRYRRKVDRLRKWAQRREDEQNRGWRAP